MLLLLAAFVAVPLVEIAAFVEVGSRIGLWPTLAVVVATAVAGSALLRLQGIAVWRRVRQSLARDETPVAEAVDGLCLLAAAALLLTPGFVTDVVGFALLVPAFRRAAARKLLNRIAGRLRVVQPGAPAGGPVIEGEFEDVDTGPRGGR